MKIDFSKAIFQNKSRVTFYGPDGLAKEWILSNLDVPMAERRKQGGDSVIIWDRILDQTIIRLSKVDEGVKLNSDNYCNFMDKTFFAWHLFQSRSFRVKCVFMRDHISSHASKLTREFLEHKRFTE